MIMMTTSHISIIAFTIIAVSFIQGECCPRFCCMSFKYQNFAQWYLDSFFGVTLILKVCSVQSGKTIKDVALASDKKVIKSSLSVI